MSEYLTQEDEAVNRPLNNVGGSCVNSSSSVVSNAAEQLYTNAIPASNVNQQDSLLTIGGQASSGMIAKAPPAIPLLGGMRHNLPQIPTMPSHSRLAVSKTSRKVPCNLLNVY